MLDGKRRGPEYDDIAFYGLEYAPDGKRAAYVARKGQDWLVVVDGKEGRPYDHFGLPTLAPTGGEWRTLPSSTERGRGRGR